MNRAELAFIKKLPTNEIKERIKSEINTLYTLGFKYSPYDSPAAICYTQGIPAGGTTSHIVYIYLRNPKLYPPGVYYQKSPYVSLWVDDDNICEADTLDQALEEIMK